MEIPKLSPQQIFALVALALAAVVVVLLAVRFLVRTGKVLLRIGCALLTLILLLVGCYLGWLALTGRA